MKSLTKGELLLTLGDSANSFTAFLMNPEAFGVVEPVLTSIRVAKQKLDWTSSINIELPDVQELIGLLESIGVVSSDSANAVRNTPDRKDLDDYLITIKAQDEITASNIYGAVFDGNMWLVRIDYYNATKNEHIIEDSYYSSEPLEEDVHNTVNSRIVEMKRG